MQNRRASVLLVPKCRRKASNTLPLKTSNTVDGRHAFVCLPHFFSRLLTTQREIVTMYQVIHILHIYKLNSPLIKEICP
jgi:hypothetical protein